MFSAPSLDSSSLGSLTVTSSLESTSTNIGCLSLISFTISTDAPSLSADNSASLVIFSISGSGDLFSGCTCVANVYKKGPNSKK